MIPRRLMSMLGFAGRVLADAKAAYTEVSRTAGAISFYKPGASHALKLTRPV